MGVVARIRAWATRRVCDGYLRRFGGIQTCPWCRQCAQDGDDWSFAPWERDAFVDVLTCGVCGGTSLWRFELGMMWIGPLAPPAPKWPAVTYYDIAEARLARTAQETEQP